MATGQQAAARMPHMRRQRSAAFSGAGDAIDGRSVDIYRRAGGLA
jgi:hypothetical protein